MNEVPYEELLQNVQSANDWHHHYLPPKCALNSTEWHQIIIEADGDSLFTLFDHKPMDELERLENLFFGRSK